MIQKVKPFVKEIKKGGHLSQTVQTIYSAYLKCKMMVKANELLGQTKIREDLLASLMDKMVTIDIYKTNTFFKLK